MKIKKVVSEVWETEDGFKFDTKEEAVDHISGAVFIGEINELLSTGLSANLSHDTEELLRDFLWNYKRQLLPIFVSYGVENLLTDENLLSDLEEGEWVKNHEAMHKLTREQLVNEQLREEPNEPSTKETPAILCKNCGSPDTEMRFHTLTGADGDEILEVWRGCEKCDHDWCAERYNAETLIGYFINKKRG